MTMLRRLSTLGRDQRGATVVEFAFAFPALIVMVYMIAQLGLVYRALSGIQHSLGEGARAATIWPRPNTNVIENRMRQAVYGIGPGTFAIDATTPTSTTILLTVTYSQPTSLLLFPGPTINVTRSKLVYTVT